MTGARATPLRGLDEMIWVFGRDDQEMRVEMRYASDTGEYLLVICWPDCDQYERFTDAAAFRARLAEIETRLAAERWERRRAPIVIPDGLPRRS
jgi:hypothetical protein